MKNSVLLLFFLFLLGACSSESSENATEVTQPKESLPVVEQTPLDTATFKPNMLTKKAPVRLGKAPVRLKMQEDMEKTHERLMEQMDKGLDPKEVQKYFKDAELYMSIYGDSLAAEYMFNAADLYNGVGEYTRALEAWHFVYVGYDLKHPKAAPALFQCAFLYDGILARKDLAKVLYTKFLRKYPKHPLANDAKVLLANLDKSPEDMVKEFQKKNQQ